MSSARETQVVRNFSRSSATILVVAVMLAASTGIAGSLLVNGGAAHTGSYGLEVVVPDCVYSRDVVASGTVSTNQNACETISTSGSTSVSGTVTFTAGAQIALASGFSVPSGATFTAAINTAVSSFAWVQDDSPADETTYTAEFYLRIPTGFDIGASDEIEHFVAYFGSDPQLKVLLGNGPDLQLQVRKDDSTWSTTAWTSALSRDVWHKVEVEWQASASATVSLTVDDGTAYQVTGIDTSDRRIASVRWGSVDGIADTADGSLHLDDFGSWK